MIKKNHFYKKEGFGKERGYKIVRKKAMRKKERAYGVVWQWYY